MTVPRVLRLSSVRSGNNRLMVVEETRNAKPVHACPANCSRTGVLQDRGEPVFEGGSASGSGRDVRWYYAGAITAGWDCTAMVSFRVPALKPGIPECFESSWCHCFHVPCRLGNKPARIEKSGTCGSTDQPR